MSITRKKIQSGYESVNDNGDDFKLTDVCLLHLSNRHYNKQRAPKSICDDEDDVHIKKIQPLHPRDQLKRKVKKDNDKIKITKLQPQRPNDRRKRKLKKLLKQVHIKTLMEDPCVEIHLNRDSSGVYKREKAIFDEILKDIPSYNDTIYIECDRENNTFLLKEDDKQAEKDRKYLDHQPGNAKLKKKGSKKNKRELKRIIIRIIGQFKQLGQDQLAVNLQKDIEDERS